MKIFTDTKGNQVYFGDTIKVFNTVKTPNEQHTIMGHFILTPANVDFLQSINAIKVSQVNNKPGITEALKKIANKLNCGVEEARELIKCIIQINKKAAYTILIKELAIIYDKEYTNHITESKDLFFINALTGEIVHVKNVDIPNIENIALFRSEEDAAAAKNALKSIIDFDKQKN